MLYSSCVTIICLFFIFSRDILPRHQSYWILSHAHELHCTVAMSQCENNNNHNNNNNNMYIRFKSFIETSCRSPQTDAGLINGIFPASETIGFRIPSCAWMVIGSDNKCCTQCQKNKTFLLLPPNTTDRNTTTSPCYLRHLVAPSKASAATFVRR